MLKLKYNKKAIQSVIGILAAVVIIGFIVWFAISMLTGGKEAVEATLDEYNDCYKLLWGTGFCISPSESCAKYDNSFDSSGISCKEDDNPEDTADMKCCTANNPKKNILLELYDGDKYIDRLAGRTQDYLSTGGADSIKITAVEFSYPEYLYGRKIKDDVTQFKLELIPVRATTKCYDGEPLALGEPLEIICSYRDDGDFSFPKCDKKFEEYDFNLNIGDCRFKLTVYDSSTEDKTIIFTKEFNFPVKI